LIIVHACISECTTALAH